MKLATRLIVTSASILAFAGFIAKDCDCKVLFWALSSGLWALNSILLNLRRT